MSVKTVSCNSSLSAPTNTVALSIAPVFVVLNIEVTPIINVGSPTGALVPPVNICSVSSAARFPPDTAIVAASTPLIVPTATNFTV